MNVSSTEYEPSADLLAEYGDEEIVDEEIVDEEMPEGELEDEPEGDDISDDMYELELDDEVVKMSKGDLSKAIRTYQSGAVDDPDLVEYKELKPVIETIKSDNALKEYVRYKASGHTSEEILDGLFLKRHPDLIPVIQQYRSGQPMQAQHQEEEEEVPVFDTIGEEAQYYAAKTVREEIQKALGQIAPNLQQLTQRQQQQEMQQQLAYVRENNQASMEAALSSLGYDPEAMTQHEFSTLASAMQDLYPGVDFRQAVITPEQAKGIVRAALGAHNTSKSQSRSFDTKQYVKTSQLPSIKPVGSSRRSSGPSDLPRIDGLSKTERKSRVASLF